MTAAAPSVCVFDVNETLIDIQHVPTGVNRDSQGAPQERV